MNHNLKEIRCQAVVFFEQKFDKLVDRNIRERCRICNAALAGTIIGVMLAEALEIPLPVQVSITIIAALTLAGAFLYYRAYHIQITQHIISSENSVFTVDTEKNQITWHTGEPNKQGISLFDDKGYMCFKDKDANGDPMFICTGTPTKESGEYAASFSRKKYKVTPYQTPRVSVAFPYTAISAEDSAFLESIC